MKLDVTEHGITIPMEILKKHGLGKDLYLKVDGEKLVITPKNNPRAGWKEAFKNAGAGNEELLFPDEMKNDFDDKDWEW